MSIGHLGKEANEKCADPYSIIAFDVHGMMMSFCISIQEAGYFVINFSSPVPSLYF